MTAKLEQIRSRHSETTWPSFIPIISMNLCYCLSTQNVKLCIPNTMSALVKSYVCIKQTLLNVILACPIPKAGNRSREQEGGCRGDWKMGCILCRIRWASGSWFQWDSIHYATMVGFSRIQPIRLFTKLQWIKLILSIPSLSQINQRIEIKPSCMASWKCPNSRFLKFPASQLGGSCCPLGSDLMHSWMILEVMIT